MSVVFTFPGQGSQEPHMLRSLPPHPVIAGTLQEASEILGEDLLLWDSEDALKSTVAVQVALLVSGVAAARALQAEGAHVDWAAGHSVGAFGAAVIAGSLAFPTALTLVKLRGELMENAFRQGYGMGVVLGIQQQKLHDIVARTFSREDPVYLANYNAPDQIVVAGSVRGVDRVLATARQEGARRAERIQVNVPSHCPLLDPVADKLAEALKEVPLRRPAIPYASNRTGRTLLDPEAIREDLAYGVSRPVRWHEAASLLVERGARLFIEMPPGRVLTNLAKTAFPSIRSVSVADSGLKTCCILANRHKAND
ncbi:malonate decarboxylase subunit epsilon [Brevibacillus sp. B_LB10_24]|uniref:malonate decarboxylase subunit epsilon n=1 Tax=Brevibacillus sp. B_LB10_24 TaxID=3380645 RepID=UPI0038BDAE53